MTDSKKKIAAIIFVGILVLIPLGLSWQSAHPVTATVGPKPQAAGVSQTSPSPSAPKPALLNRADFIKGAENVCEQFTERNNSLQVKWESENAFEVPIKHPIENQVIQIAHIGLTYRAGSDGILMRADCKVAKLADTPPDKDFIMEKWSATAQ